MRLAAYLLWIPGLFAVIAAVILPAVSPGLSRRRAAASWPQIGCGQVRAGVGMWGLSPSTCTAPVRQGRRGCCARACRDRSASGYRVQEDILRPGLPFYVFAVPGEPIMAGRYQDVWAISADPMPASLAARGKRTRSWALRFGLAGLALFAASALLLTQAGGPPG
jgi:hypothetical protein